MTDTIAAESAEPADVEPADEGGLEVEKWILRVLLLAVAAVALTSLLGSIDDLRRYWRIKQM